MSLLRRLLPLLAALPLAACGDAPLTPESDADKTPTEVQSQADAASVEALEQSIATYTASVATYDARMAEIETEMRTLAPGDILGSKGTAIGAEAEQIRRDLVRLNRNLRIYTEALEAKR